MDYVMLYPGNDIHPSAIIHSNANIGTGNKIGANVIIGENVKIGNNNCFFPGCVVGTPAQHKTADLNGFVLIGDNNVIREYVTIHAGTNMHTTIINNGCYLMCGVHIGHDAYLEDNVTLANNVLLGGHVYVGKGANLGLGVIVHQKQVIGGHSMIGMGSVVTKKSFIMPNQKFVGSPVEYLGENHANLNNDDFEKAMEVFQKKYESVVDYLIGKKKS